MQCPIAKTQAHILGRSRDTKGFPFTGNEIADNKAATPYIRLITTATMPRSKAMLPQTTKVLAENIVMNPLKPLAHHGERPPAENRSEVLFTILPSITPRLRFPEDK
jgi:hypothetical protein